jgi:ribonuclease BN (tRNA processing enzyme)
MPRAIRVRFLGTGGAANERRHQACLLVEWGDPAADGRVLLDTGGGMDVVRRLIAAGCPPGRVRDIFVSHQHLDHVGGLEPLLLWSAIQAFRHGDGPRDETRLHADATVLADIERMFAAVATVAPRLLGERLRRTVAVDGAWARLPGEARLATFLVDHPPEGRGPRGCLVEVDGRRLVYSGDTRPTARLVDAARDADVLVHEVGGLDADAATVHRHGHSTAGDAGRAARAAGAGRLVLTHVPTEDLIGVILAEARAAFEGPVHVAADDEVLEV